MTPEKCPACGMKLKPDMLACPNCPMSFPEDEGPAGLSNPLRQSRYYQFVFPVVFFGGIAWGVWALAVGYMRLGEDNFAKSESLDLAHEKELVKGAGASMTQAGTKAAPVAPPSAAPGAAAGGIPVLPGSESADAPSNGDDVLIISHVGEEPAARPARKPRRVREWKLRGVVYDLTTLQPLAGAELDFKDEDTNKLVKTRTDSLGRYRTIVPPLGERGYSVAVSKSGYAPNYLDPSIAGAKRLSASRRLEMARSLAATLTAAPATIAAPNEAPFVTDFYLAPRP